VFGARDGGIDVGQPWKNEDVTVKGCFRKRGSEDKSSKSDVKAKGGEVRGRIGEPKDDGREIERRTRPQQERVEP